MAKALGIYTKQGLAAELGVSISTIDRAIARGDLHIMKAAPGRSARVLIHADAVREWLDRGAA